jgi:hypothetical protein
LLQDSKIEQVLCCSQRQNWFRRLFSFLFSSLLVITERKIASTLFPDTEASIMSFVDTWLSFWTSLGSIATLLTAWLPFGLFLRFCQPKQAAAPPPPDPSLELLKEIRDVLKDMCKDQKEATDALKSGVVALEAGLESGNAALKASTDAIVPQLERIEGELRRLNTQSGRDVVRIVTQGPWSTLM